MTQTILRPNFTKNIHQHYIKKGKSLNIFGAKGVGKSRFIEDLKSLIGNDTNFVSLNMVSLGNDYKLFLKRLKEKLSIKDESINSVELVLSKFARKQGKKLLVIDDFEYLFRDYHDKKFNLSFLDELNSFKNREDVSLIILSTHNYKHYPLYNDNELRPSPLDINIKEITPMMEEEIVDELKRDIKIDLGFDLLATMIMGKDYPYSFIRFIIEEIDFGNYRKDDFLERNFDRWEKGFKKTYRISWYLILKKYIQKFFNSLTLITLLDIIKEVLPWEKKKG